MKSPSFFLRKLVARIYRIAMRRMSMLTASREHVFYSVSAVVILLLSVCGMGEFIPALDAAHPFGRLTYSFRHVSVFHAGVNLFVLWQILRNFHVSVSLLCVAYLISVMVPPVLITSPVVGLSVCVYALLGLILPSVGQKRRYIVSILVFMIPQAIIPHIAWHLHLYAFLTGMALVIPCGVDGFYGLDGLDGHDGHDGHDGSDGGLMGD